MSSGKQKETERLGGPRDVSASPRCTPAILANGMRVYAVEMPHLHTASVALYVRCGSRFETRKTNGISHFLEHMVFRGTARYPDAYLLNRCFDRLGSSLDATSFRDCTSFSIHLRPEGVDEALRLIADVVSSPTYQGLDIERNVLIEETLEYLDEDGRNVDLDDLEKALRWPRHPLGMTITGPVANLERFDAEDLDAHRRRFYVASNMALAVAGPIDPESIVRAVDRHFGSVASGTPAPLKPLSRPGKVLFRRVRNDNNQTELRVSFETVPAGHPDELACELARAILDEGMTSRLQRRVCDERGLAYDVRCTIESYADVGLFCLDGTISHHRSWDLLEQFADLLVELKDEPVADDEWELVMSRARWALQTALDDVDSVAHWYAGTAMYRPAEHLTARLGQLELISPADLQRVARRYFVPERLAVVCLGQVYPREIKRWRDDLPQRFL
ncbi:MAG: insulinase family protein [Myxococcales bacterium]|nr:insulinase family protein [Myxococcales bacterium]